MGVGLDIGSKTIKIVELARDGSGWKLRASGIVGYTGNSPEQMKDGKEAGVLAQTIKKLHGLLHGLRLVLSNGSLSVELRKYIFLFYAVKVNYPELNLFISKELKAGGSERSHSCECN